MAGDMTTPAIWETTDLGSAAYALSRGLSIRSVNARPDKQTEFMFRFDDPQGRGPALQIDYINSDCRKFDESVRALKKLCYGDANGRRRGGNDRRWTV